MIKERKNFSVRFFDMNPFIEHSREKFPITHDHISVAAYYRIFILRIFTAYKRVVYSDCDVIINTDISKLYNIDLQGRSLGACSYWEAIFGIDMSDENSSDERNKALLARARRFIEQVPVAKNYFDHVNFITGGKWKKNFLSALLVLDVEKLSRENFFDRCMEYLSNSHSRKKILNEDQDLLNILCDNVKIIDRKWNMLWYYPLVCERKNAYVLHYGACVLGRPWNDMEISDLWWKYAERSPFYYEIIITNLKTIVWRKILRMVTEKHRWHDLPFG
jgi:lipopolysaccharide biosynthesis glycosyltransferase